MKTHDFGRMEGRNDKCTNKQIDEGDFYSYPPPMSVDKQPDPSNKMYPDCSASEGENSII